MEIRLNKYISESGLCTRREADRMIEAGKVTINRRVATVGDKVKKGDQVRVSGNLLDYAHDAVYIALNKPSGVVSTADSAEQNSVVRLVNFPMRVFNVGRLGKNTEGLILLTNDGDTASKLISAENNFEKQYEVVLDKPITQTLTNKLEQGVKGGADAKRCQIKEITTHALVITLKGTNLEVRAICEAQGFKVLRLRRTKAFGISLSKELAVGQWKMLDDKEVEELLRSVEGVKVVQQGSSSANKGAKKKKKIFHNPGASSSAASAGGRGGSFAGGKGRSSGGGGVKRSSAPTKGKAKASKGKYTPKKQS